MFVPRTLSEMEAGPGRGALARAVVVGGLIALALFLTLSTTFTLGQVDLQAGDRSEEGIRAPRSVSYESQVQTEAERDAAAAAVDPVYEDIRPPLDIRREQLADYDRAVGRVRSVLEDRDTDGLGPAEVVPRLAALVPELDAPSVELLAGLSVSRWDQMTESGRLVLEQTLTGQIRREDLGEVRQVVRSRITDELPEPERQLIGDLAAAYVAANSTRSAVLTDQAQDDARAAVPPVLVSIDEGELVVPAGTELSEAQIEALEQLGLTQPAAEIGTILGYGLVALVLAGLIVGFLWRFEPQIWYRNRPLLLFALALLVSAVALRIAGDRTLWAYVVPTSASVLLIGILLGGYAGGALAVALSVIAGVVNSESLGPAVYVLAGGVASLVAIVSAERLNAFVRAGVLLAVTNLAVVIAFALLDQRDVAAMLQLAGAAVVNAGLSVVLAVGSFAMLGNLFGIMTVFQLLELANPSNRLLRRLLLETPGTYHHSVMVGNLAERAAETIGADPLLARVAAYYHDIGKMKNPLAFIENQAGSRNVHDDLTAETSARIISGHIRDGIDLGYEHGLPVQIIGFIPQHHGTSVMSYFYGKSLREVGGNQEQVDTKAFRYPGPKPQSREAAILMLADGVEASVRALDEKDEPSIRAMVDRIVDGRIEDGQLDDADLTLKNIAQIKEAFVQQLLGMYHSRIKYPDNVVPIEQRERA